MTTATFDADKIYLTHSQPSNGSTNFRVNQNLWLGFIDGTLTAGEGNIIISNGTDTLVIDISDSEQVSFKSDYFSTNVIINPTEDLIPGTTYSLQIESGVIVNSKGDSFSGLNDEFQLNFTTVADTSPPSFNYSISNSRRFTFKTDNDIYLTFDEAVMAGSGYFIISNEIDTRTIDIKDTNQVSFNEGTMTINPTDDLLTDTIYSVQMASGVITDTVGHAYAGFSNASITTHATDPLLVYSNPINNALDFKADDDIRLSFDETVAAGSGAIIISNGLDTRVIDIEDTNQVTFETGTSSSDGYGTVFSRIGSVTINPTTDLIAGRTYSVQVSKGVIVDSTGHAYAGFSDASITTIAPDPLLYGSISGHNGNIRVPEVTTAFKVDGGFRLFFDEIVAAGSGDIVFSNGMDTRIIDISDTSQVTFDYGRVTICPTEDLIANTTYSVKMASGVIVDTAGNTFAGLSGASFTTIDSNPLLLSSNPIEEGQALEADDSIELYFDEIVTAGNGGIVISNGVDTRIIDISDTTQITFDEYQYGDMVRHGSVVINPIDDLVANTTYSVQMASGVLIDTTNHAYAGISNATAFNFTTVEPVIVIEGLGFMFF